MNRPREGFRRSALFALALVALLALLALGASASFASEAAEVSTPEIMPLYVLAVSVEGEIGAGAPWVKLELKSPDDVARRNESARLGDDGLLFLDLGSVREQADEPEEAHLAATFLVDFDEPPVQELLETVERPKDDAKAVDALLALTDAAIPEKTLLRDWDAASVVVRRGEGDCTEHAVLLAALARAWNLPARVAVGPLLAVFEDRVEAYGHAWTEVFVDGTWRRADAAQIVDPEALDPETTEEHGEPAPRLYYLPLVRVESEGPGYTMPLMNLIVRTHPRSIVVGWGELVVSP